MARHEHGVLAAELANQLPHFHDLNWVQAGDGLVQDHELRFVDDGLGNADSLLVAVRQRGDRILMTIGERGQLFDRADAPSDVFGRHAAEPRRERQIVPDAHVTVKRRDVREIPDALAHRFRPLDDVDAVDTNRARGRQQIAREDAERGGLARAVHAEKADDFSLTDFYGNGTERPCLPVVLIELPDFDQRLGSPMRAASV